MRPDHRAAELVGLHCREGVLKHSQSIAARGTQLVLGHAITDVFEEGMDPVGEGLPEVMGAGFGHDRCAFGSRLDDAGLPGAPNVRGFPVGDTLDAVLNAEGAARASNLDAPPAPRP